MAPSSKSFLLDTTPKEGKDPKVLSKQDLRRRGENTKVETEIGKSAARKTNDSFPLFVLPGC